MKGRKNVVFWEENTIETVRQSTNALCGRRIVSYPQKGARLLLDPFFFKKEKK